uniref:Uncharacterized protein n=1 Tax=Arundo donax TaxID=35708 RepID=A0A0A8ZFH1_ARUDO
MCYDVSILNTYGSSVYTWNRIFIEIREYEMLALCSFFLLSNT